MTQLAQLLKQYAQQQQLDLCDGVYDTDILGLRFYISQHGSARQALVYQSGIMILAQGHKNIFLQQQQFQYGADEYLVLGVPMPLECEAVAPVGDCLMGLLLDVDPKVLGPLVQQIFEFQTPVNKMDTPSLFALQSTPFDQKMRNASLRLVSALLDKVEAQILGPTIVREIIYHVLCGPSRDVLINLVNHDSHYARVARVLDKIHIDYAQGLSVQGLANDANMSISAFHTAFRSVTLESPLQYLKKIRLNKAKELIQFQGKRINEAARLVGYSSASQFSREYRRQFEHSPRASNSRLDA
ncbi:AraC family transcriptional regulator [Alginatibacterium sediminis]|uniref:AraC family transcriptional regulator n=1 Tax=Alginatibacterium sediminis TaxID=2164068 RepID=A0A420EH89_9ALTE|nr:AraC family transcriptional regulator [Alginatibacterium sediminis]RKF20075.1 AraC family transcriptional regulator [Alginatibacterium sediminis]